MQTHIEFATVLFRGDEAALNVVRSALTEPAEFVRVNATELGYVRPTPGWYPDKWSLVLDVAGLRGWVFEVDWRADVDEVTEAVRDLIPARALSFDWDAFAASNEDETREYLRALARALEPLGERLVSLDRGSDSYYLALITPATVSEARRLVAEIGFRVEDLRE